MLLWCMIETKLQELREKIITEKEEKISNREKKRRLVRRHEELHEMKWEAT